MASGDSAMTACAAGSELSVFGSKRSGFYLGQFLALVQSLASFFIGPEPWIRRPIAQYPAAWYRLARTTQAFEILSFVNSL